MIAVLTYASLSSSYQTSSKVRSWFPRSPTLQRWVILKKHLARNCLSIEITELDAVFS